MKSLSWHLNGNPFASTKTSRDASNHDGKTGDSCSSKSDCDGDRICICTEGECSCADGGCICFQSLPCSSNAECETGEVCAFLIQDNPACVSEDVVRRKGIPVAEPLRPGLSKDPCELDSHCKSPRECIDEECIPTGGLTSCTGAPKDCHKWEVCATSPLDGEDVCVSLRFTSNNTDWIPVTTKKPTTTSVMTTVTSTTISSTAATTKTTSTLTTTTTTRMTTKAPTSSAPASTTVSTTSPTTTTTTSTTTQSTTSSTTTGGGAGLTFDDCEDNSDCKGSRECEGAGEKITDDEDAKVCKLNDGTASCEENDDCEDGENCINFDGADSCISERAIDKYELDICVAVHHLNEEGIEMSQRVFNTDRLANVLCDYNTSCATPGHMVMYNGRGMMMRSYCEIVGCRPGIMRVNSPKFRKQIRLNSHSEGLVFTALAAKWGTATEERVLRGLIRLGV